MTTTTRRERAGWVLHHALARACRAFLSALDLVLAPRRARRTGGAR
ncbi:hypothetical protein [Nocardioides sp. AX2bis]|nr:hypothetical protein [Nocardioides sp. AX2bis]